MEDELLNRDLGEKDSEWDISASRVTQAIEEDKFCLFCQVIIPMKQSVNMCTHHEILIRMSEEEDNLIPPGTFLPFVRPEMPHLARRKRSTAEVCSRICRAPRVRRQGA